MALADWLVFLGALSFVVIYGLMHARRTRTVAQYLVTGRSLPWHVVGLSVMATQASAVTFISTTGQSYVDGMRFVQFYFGLPIAMLILCYTAVPLFHRSGVFTAYEYLERRFDARTRALLSAIFLIQRGLALGITLYAPAVVLSVVFGWPDSITTVLIGTVAVAYTTLGGTKAIAWTDLQQMLVMTLGLVAALVSAVYLLPADVSLADAVSLANMARKLDVVTTNFNWQDRYNLWSGLIGGTFLALAYFGTDQSQVQRYLGGRSISDSRRGLLLNAAAKIPMQLFILFIGAMVFVFYLFQPPPLLLQRTKLARIQSEEVRSDLQPIAARYDRAVADRRQAAQAFLQATEQNDVATADGQRQAFARTQAELDAARADAATLARKAGGSGASDTNYVFLTFVTSHLPAGVVGLVLAVICGATMTAISAEMSALATVSVVDIYKRHVRPSATDRHYLVASRLGMLFWGVYAVISAQFIKGLGSLVEVVNVLGSLFYGGMLGVFILAFFVPRVGAKAAFYAVLAGEAVIFACWYGASLAFLWYNVVGCVVVVVAGVLLSPLDQRRPEGAQYRVSH